MERTLEDIYQNEIHPELYIKRQKEIRRREKSNAIDSICLVIFMGFLFALLWVL